MAAKSAYRIALALVALVGYRFREDVLAAFVDPVGRRLGVAVNLVSALAAAVGGVGYALGMTHPRSMVPYASSTRPP